MIQDQEIYHQSCQVSKVLVLSIFHLASELWNSANMYYITDEQLFPNNVKTYLWEKLLIVD